MNVPKVRTLTENVIYAELLSRGYQVYVGRMQEKEIDFVALRGSERIYVQVAYFLNSDKVIERKFGNLASIRDNYPKYVISMDDYPVTMAYPGIRQLHLQDFLTASQL